MAPGYNELGEMCQVCHHEPLDKTLCEPNKVLRLTVKAWLKKKLHEKAALRKKEEDAAAKAEAAKQNGENARQADSPMPNGQAAYNDASSKNAPTGDGSARENQADASATPVPDERESRPNTAVDGEKDQVNVLHLIIRPLQAYLLMLSRLLTRTKKPQPSLKLMTKNTSLPSNDPELPALGENNQPSSRRQMVSGRMAA